MHDVRKCKARLSTLDERTSTAAAAAVQIERKSHGNDNKNTQQWPKWQ